MNTALFWVSVAFCALFLRTKKERFFYLQVLFFIAALALLLKGW